MPSYGENVITDMQKAGVKNFEMEASCLFTLGSLFGLMTGCVCVVVADRVLEGFEDSDKAEVQCAQVACEAAKILAGK